MMKIKKLIRIIFGIAIALLLTVGFNFRHPVFSATKQQISLTVSAAISLTDALQDIKQVYVRSKPNIAIAYNFGASGVLQQQIEQGAPVDVFISASVKQMDALQEKGLLIAQTRRNLLTNRLVLIVPKNGLALSSFRDLTNSQVKRIAIGEPRTVPAGQYAIEVMTNLNILDGVRSKLVFANNVRQVLTYVETGNVDAGIVYITDSRSDRVRLAATAPSNLHSPIVYPVAVLKDSRNVNAAREYVQFLSGSIARSIFEKYGFILAN